MTLEPFTVRTETGVEGLEVAVPSFRRAAWKMIKDILIIGSHLKKVGAVKRSLASKFQMKCLGEMKSYLGMKIEQFIDERYLRD